MKKTIWKLASAFAALLCVASLFYAVSHGREEEGATAPVDGVFLPILMYHSIENGADPNNDYILPAETLEADLAYLQSHNYHTVFIKEVIDHVYGGTPLPENPIVLTFDDGFYNNYTHVWPLLEKYEMKAVLSIVGDYTEQADKGGANRSDYTYVSWKDIADLAACGYFEIGNHTYGMHKIGIRQGCKRRPFERPESYRAALEGDVGKLQDKLATITGSAPVIFSFPFGYIAKDAYPILREMGFQAFLSAHEKPNYITRDPACLLDLNRYNRPARMTTEAYMEMILQKQG